MQRSLTNHLLGILTVSEIHDLIDVFRGKGKRDITPFLQQYLKKLDQEELVIQNEDKQSLIESLNDDDDDEVVQAKDIFDVSDSEEKKGVLFILDSFKKTRKSQELLKSREVINLYLKINSETKKSNSSLEISYQSKSKGILINKKQA